MKRSKQELKQERSQQKRFHRGNLRKLSPHLSLLHDGQSTDDSLLRKDKGEDMKPRTRPSRADGSLGSRITGDRSALMTHKSHLVNPGFWNVMPCYSANGSQHLKVL